MEQFIAAALATAVLAGLIAVGVRLRRRRTARLHVVDDAPATEPLGPIVDMVGSVLKGSLGLVAGLLRSDQIDGMVAEDGTVTLLFSDIEDSTRLTVAVGDDEWSRIIGVHDRVSGRLVTAEGGRVVKRQGDGLMAVLPSAPAGLSTALALREGLRHHPEIGRPLLLRIGVHAGEVIDREGDYFGANVALAARVADAAVGDQILVSQAARDRMGEGAERLAATRPRRLKGLPGKHRLYEVRS